MTETPHDAPDPTNPLGSDPVNPEEGLAVGPAKAPLHDRSPDPFAKAPQASVATGVPINPFLSPNPVEPGTHRSDGSTWTWKATTPWIVIAVLGGVAVFVVLMVLAPLTILDPLTGGIGLLLLLLPAAITGGVVLTIGLIRRGRPNALRAIVYSWRAFALTSLVAVLIPVAALIFLLTLCFAEMAKTV